MNTISCLWVCNSQWANKWINQHSSKGPAEGTNLKKTKNGEESDYWKVLGMDRTAAGLKTLRSAKKGEGNKSSAWEEEFMFSSLLRLVGLSGGTQGPVQWRSFSSLLCRRPLRAVPAWAGASTPWCFPFNISSADNSIALPFKAPWGMVLEKLSRQVTSPNHVSFRLLTVARQGSRRPMRKLSCSPSSHWSCAPSKRWRVLSGTWSQDQMPMISLSSTFITVKNFSVTKKPPQTNNQETLEKAFCDAL